jgi:predicted ester cyclase
MTVEQNKQVVLDFFAAHGRGDIEAAASFYADNGINHGMQVTRDQIKLVLQDLANTFSVDVRIETIVAEDDWVVARTVQSGTHVGKNIVPINMLTPGTEPTGKQFKGMQIIHMFRLADGWITEHWAGRDDLGLHWQLGLIEAPDWYKARMG